jgi:hypothetical protein
MAVGSWDGRLRVYEHALGNGIVLKGSFDMGGEPVLGCTWNHQGTRILSAVDTQVRMLDATTG